MQTLLDPFEIAPRTPPCPPATTPTPPPTNDVVTSLGEIDVRLEEDATPLEPEPELDRDSRPSRSPDSSGRLRCWCSED
jgi:hypothetical protein